MMLYNAEKDGQVLKQDNLVIVSVWTSEENEAIPGANVGHISIETPTRYMSLWPGPREHHVSRDDLNKFQAAKRPITNFFEQRPPSFKAEYLDDAVCEALSEEHYRPIDYFSQLNAGEVCVLIRDKEVICCDKQPTMEKDDALFAVVPLQANVRIGLYGLSLKNMHDKFDVLVANTPGWRMIGSNGLTRLLNSTSPESCASLVLRVLHAGGMYAELSSTESSKTSSAVKPDVLLKQVVAAKEKEIHHNPYSKDWAFPGASNLDHVKQSYDDEKAAKKLDMKGSGFEKK